MIYAEKRLNESGVVDHLGAIVEKGIFMSMSEFLPYRLDGWSSTKDINKEADERLRLLAETPDSVVNYLAPMHKLGRDYRMEKDRRRKD